MSAPLFDSALFDPLVFDIGNIQSLSLTTDDAVFSASQTLEHNQSLSLVLDDAVFSANQSEAIGSTQTLALVTDDAIVSITQTKGEEAASSNYGGAKKIRRSHRSVKLGPIGHEAYANRIFTPEIAEQLKQQISKPDKAEIAETMQRLGVVSDVLEAQTKAQAEQLENLELIRQELEAERLAELVAAELLAKQQAEMQEEDDIALLLMML